MYTVVLVGLVTYTPQMDRGKIHSNPKDEWQTPDEFRQAVWNLVSPVGVPQVDLAADKNSALCDSFIGKTQNALRVRWPNVMGFCNPPFSLKEAFIEKAAASPGPTVMILPADTSTRWYARLEQVAWIHLCTGRVPFFLPGMEKKSTNPGGSCVALFNWPDGLKGAAGTWDWRNWTDEKL